MGDLKLPLHATSGEMAQLAGVCTPGCNRLQVKRDPFWDADPNGDKQWKNGSRLNLDCRATAMPCLIAVVIVS